MSGLAAATAFTTALAGAGVVAAVVFRRVRTAAVTRFVAARLPAPDASGIVAGAAPVVLARDATRAVLVLHGFADTPQSVEGLARHLADVHGCTVHAPLLPGHGRTLAAFAASRADDWVACAHEAFDALAATHARVAVVGLSMGGALATLVAARAATRCAGLVLLAPYLTPTPTARRVARTAPLGQALVPWFAPNADPSQSIRDPEALAANLGYGTASPALVRELVAVADAAHAAAASVRVPVAIVHGRRDYRVPAALAATHPALFAASPSVTLDWLDDTGHVLTADRQRARVFARCGAFCDSVLGAASS